MYKIVYINVQLSVFLLTDHIHVPGIQMKKWNVISCLHAPEALRGPASWGAAPRRAPPRPVVKGSALGCRGGHPQGFGGQEEG